VVRGETARRFRLGVGLDLSYPAPAALDFLAPRTMALEKAIPPSARSGWLFHLDARNVIVTHWEPVVAEGRVVGFRARLLETEGRRVTAALRCFRPVGSAERIDFGHQPPSELSVADDQIKMDLGPYQFTQIEARWVE
jgi:alpha-mannosidase